MEGLAQVLKSYYLPGHEKSVALEVVSMYEIETGSIDQVN